MVKKILIRKGGIVIRKGGIAICTGEGRTINPYPYVRISNLYVYGLLFRPNRNTTRHFPWEKSVSDVPGVGIYIDLMLNFAGNGFFSDDTRNYR